MPEADPLFDESQFASPTERQANALHDLMESFIKAGFTREEAFAMLASLWRARCNFTYSTS